MQKLRSIKPETVQLKPFKKRSLKKTICVLDFETDPFGAVDNVRPFCWGFYDGDTYVDYWGDDCIQEFAKYMETRRSDNLLVYAHNGGKFDFMFLMDYFDDNEEPLIINTRITKVMMFGQEFRDSYSLIPVPLSKFKKMADVDYDLMKREVREDHKDFILEYQRSDCFNTREMITTFIDRYGDSLTMAQTSIKVLESMRGFNRMNDAQDLAIRPFYYGGRVECFKTGVIEGDWKIYDVNSMYPYVMLSEKHPVSAQLHKGRSITEETAFAIIDIAYNKGCLLQKTEEHSLDFDGGAGRYLASIHEIKAGLETKTLVIKRVIQTFDFTIWSDFSDFVQPLYDERMSTDDEGAKLFIKLILNSAYGKLGANPRSYGATIISRDRSIPKDQFGPYDALLNPHGWKLKSKGTWGSIWERMPQGKRLNLFNVATAASITGAARALLHRGLVKADNPAYCDTDSIICEGLSIARNTKALGDWKLEAEGSILAIAGKKMYALFDKDGKSVKQASKGGKMTAEQIKQVSLGDTISITQEAPTFKLDGTYAYQTRRFKRTGKADVEIIDE